MPFQLHRKKDLNLKRIRSDHGREFKNAKFVEFCDLVGIHHKFSTPITPQQNRVVERRNMTLQEIAQAMLHAKHMPLHYGAEAFNTACHIHNCVVLCLGISSIIYEIWRGRRLNVKYFHIFGSFLHSC